MFPDLAVVYVEKYMKEICRKIQVVCSGDLSSSQVWSNSRKTINLQTFTQRRGSLSKLHPEHKIETMVLGVFSFCLCPGARHLTERDLTFPTLESSDVWLFRQMTSQTFEFLDTWSHRLFPPKKNDHVKWTFEIGLQIKKNQALLYFGFWQIFFEFWKNKYIDLNPRSNSNFLFGNKFLHLIWERYWKFSVSYTKQYLKLCIADERFLIWPLSIFILPP